MALFDDGSAMSGSFDSDVIFWSANPAPSLGEPLIDLESAPFEALAVQLTLMDDEFYRLSFDGSIEPVNGDDDERFAGIVDATVFDAAHRPGTAFVGRGGLEPTTDGL